MKKYLRLEYIFLAIAIIFMLLSYWLGLFIDIGRDAGKYATVAKELVETNDWVNLTILEEPYNQKPHLLFWLSAMGYLIGDYSNFWFKILPVAFVFISFYATFRLGTSLYNKRVGLIAALFSFFSFIYSHYSMDIHTDTLLQTFTTFALWQLYEFLQSKKSIHAFAGFLAIGLGVLSKGPIAMAIPAFAIAGYILSTKNYKLILDFRWYLGILFSLIIALPALYHLYRNFGWDGITFFFWDNNVGRVTGTYKSTYNDPFYYIHSSLYLLIPWSLLFFYSAFLDFKSFNRDEFKTQDYYIFWGILVYFIIINLSKAQLPNYIFSIIPLMFILVAKWFDIGLKSNLKIINTFKKIQTFVVILLWFAITVAVFYFFPPSWSVLYIVLLLLLVTTILSFSTVKNKVYQIILPSILSLTAVALLLNTNINPYFYSFQAVPKAARYYNKNAESQDELYNYRYSQYELYFYSDKSAKDILSYEELVDVIKNKNSWIFTNQDGYNDIMKINNQPEKIIHYKHIYINHMSKFILPSTRNKNLHKMYLIKY